MTIALVAGRRHIPGYAMLVAGYAGRRYPASMTPTLGVGPAIDRVAPAQSVRVGDVITFDDPFVKGRSSRIASSDRPGQERASRARRR